MEGLTHCLIHKFGLSRKSVAPQSAFYVFLLDILFPMLYDALQRQELVFGGVSGHKESLQ